VTRAVNRERLQVWLEYLRRDDLADVGAAVHQGDQVLGPLDRRPIHLAVPGDNAHALVAIQLQIHLANRAQERFIDGTLPHLRIRRVSPDGRQLVARHCGAVEDEAIEEILVHRIRHLDYDGAYGPGKRRMADQCDAKLVVEISSVVLAEADDVGGFPRGKTLVDNTLVSMLDLTNRGSGRC
jgi:hypothetical protein